MCLSVDYHCICGVVARTELVACGPSMARPHCPDFEETHQLQQITLVLPREEWNARQGVCPQPGCPQNMPAADAGGPAAKSIIQTRKEIYICPGCSTLITQGETPAAETAVDDAKFLDRSLWDTHNCTVEFCPFNMESMVQANEKLATIVKELQQSQVIRGWRPEEDAQILDLSSHGADAELIANVIGRKIADVEMRLDYLGPQGEPAE